MNHGIVYILKYLTQIFQVVMQHLKAKATIEGAENIIDRARGQ